MGAYRINGNLAVSRALGDSLERPFVSSEPDICELERSDDDKFILVASDGLWDVISSQEACDFVKQIMAGSMRGGGSRTPGNVKERGVIRAIIETRRVGLLFLVFFPCTRHRTNLLSIAGKNGTLSGRRSIAAGVVG